MLIETESSISGAGDSNDTKLLEGYTKTHSVVNYQSYKIFTGTSLMHICNNICIYYEKSQLVAATVGSADEIQSFLNCHMLLAWKLLSLLQFKPTSPQLHALRANS